jgi:hypothetical protein
MNTQASDAQRDRDLETPLDNVPEYRGSKQSVNTAVKTGHENKIAAYVPSRR